MCKFVQSLWVGRELSILEILCIKSFLANNINFHLYLYESISNIPEGTIIKDASDIISKEKIFKYGKNAGKGEGSYSGFSNYFRYLLLDKNGGYWVDLDIICLRDFLNNQPYLFASEIGPHKLQQPASCIIKTPPKCELTSFWIKKCEKKNFSELKWGEIGPYLVADGIKQYELSTYIKPVFFCCPINFFDVETIIERATYYILDNKEIYALHLWNEMWRRRQIDKNKKYDPSSIYEYLKSRYL
jgi:hypothetical protein